MLKLLIATLWLLIIPEFLGLGILYFSKEDKKNMMLSIIIGYLLGFMIYEILAIPMTYMECTFNTLSYTWISIMIVLFLISVILIRHNLKEILISNFNAIKQMNKGLLAIFLILIVFQCYVGFTYMHEDYDDSNFIAKATIAKDTNTLHKYDDIGNEYASLPVRQVFSPFPFYTATISLIINIHPAILARTVFPVIFIPLAYIVYAMIANVLFKENKNQALIFLIILSFIYMFGAYSVYTNFVFLLYRVWQGKSILANIIIPFIWLIFLKYINKDEKFLYWFILFITLWGADLLSSMALCLATMVTGVLSLIYAIKDRKISYLFKTAICVLPSIAYGIMYLNLGGLS